jgi:hypothetical protein
MEGTVSLTNRYLSVLKFKLNTSQFLHWLEDFWTDPSTHIRCAPANSQYPSPQLVIFSKSVGAQNIHSGLQVGNRNEQGALVFHGNRLCHLLMTINLDCRDVVDALMSEADEKQN